MKNRNRPEYQCEQSILEEVNSRGSVCVDDVKAVIGSRDGLQLSDQEVLSVIHGLKKEGRLIEKAETLFLSRDH